MLLFAAIVLGLAISDLAISLHRLLNAGDRVKWGLLAPLAGVVAFLKILTQWWSWYAAEGVARSLTFEMFITVMVGAVLLFLMTAAALPDIEAGETSIDLPTYFLSIRRRFWLLFAMHWAVMNGVSIWAQMQINGAQLNLSSPAYLLFPAALAMMFIPWRWVHAVGLALLAGLYVMQFAGQHLALVA